MSMSHTRVHALLSGQTNLAKKLFWVVPISEAWDVSRIISEYSRTSGGIPSRNVVEGALHALVDAGLVRQPDQYHYIKDPIKPKRPYNKEKEPEMATNCNAPAPAPAPAHPLTAFDMMAAFAADMRDMAKRAEDIALKVEEEMQANAAAAEKLHALQALLKGL